MTTYSNVNASASRAAYDSSSGDSVAFQYNGRTSAKRKRCPRDIGSDSNSSESEDNAPLSESEDDSNDVDIVPSRKACRTVEPMGVSLCTAVTHGFQTNDGNYCPSEGTDDDDASAEDNMRASSGGLSNDVAAVADTSVAATTRHRKTTVDKDVHEDDVARATVMRPRTVTIIEKSIILMMHSFFRFHVALAELFIQALIQRNSRASISDLIARIVRRKNSIVASTWTNFLKGDKITQVTIPGNRTKKATRTPHLNSVIVDTQSFVRERRYKHERDVAKDVIAVLERKKHITVNRDSPKTIESATWTFRRFIRAFGYKRGKKKDVQTYQLKQINRRL
jgi:hypothetical protein